MGTAASCHVACTSEQAVEVAPSLYPFALPARASPQLRELVEAVRSCSALDDLEQTLERCRIKPTVPGLPKVAHRPGAGGRFASSEGVETHNCLTWAVLCVLHRSRERHFSRYRQECTAELSLTQSEHDMPLHALCRALEEGQPVDMRRAAELAAAWLPRQPIAGPAWAVRAMQWLCNTLSERLGRGELCPLSAAEQALLDPLEALMLRCYPDTLEPIDENAHWLAALKAGLEAVQQPPFVHLPVLGEQSRRPTWAQELVSATKATMYMLASCMEIESSYTPASKAMDAMRNLRRLMQEVGSLPALNQELVQWATRLLRRVELEAKMVSAMEAQDMVAAQRLLDTAQQNHADTEVLGELVTHTQRMIQTLNQEEAALFASLRALLKRESPYGGTVKGLSRWRMALSSAKAKALAPPTTGGAAFVDRGLPGLPGLLKAVDAHIDIIQQIENLSGKGGNPSKSAAAGRFTPHSLSVTPPLSRLLKLPGATSPTSPPARDVLPPLRETLTPASHASILRSTTGMDDLLSGETHRSTAANATFLQASISNYKSAGLPIFPDLLTLAEEHIERQLMEAKLQRAVAQGDFSTANQLMTEIGEGNMAVDASLVRNTITMMDAKKESDLREQEELERIRKQLAALTDGEYWESQMVERAQQQHLEQLLAAREAAQKFRDDKELGEHLVIADVHLMLIRKVVEAIAASGPDISEREKRRTALTLRETLERLRYTLKIHTNVKGMVEHVKALTNQLELEAKLQHIIANAKSPSRHTTSEVRRALNQSMGIAHEVLLSRVKLVLTGAELEDELLAAANLKDEVRLVDKLRAVRACSAARYIRPEALDEANTVLLIVRVVSLCAEAAQSGSVPELEAALEETKALDVLKDQRHVALLEAREELNDIRRSLEMLRARDRVRDFMSPLDVSALQKALRRARVLGLDDPIMLEAQQVLDSLPCVQQQGRFSPSGGPYNGSDAWHSNPQYKVSFGRCHVDFVNLVAILVDDSAVEDGDAALTFGQHKGLAMLHGLSTHRSSTSTHGQAGRLGNFALHAMENGPGLSAAASNKMQLDAVVRAATPYSSQASVLRIDHVSTKAPLFLVPSTMQNGLHGGYVLTVIVEAVGIDLSVMQVMDANSSILQAINKGDLLELGRLLGPGASIIDTDQVDPKVLKQGTSFLAKRRAESELYELLRNTMVPEVLKAKLEHAKTVKGVDAALLEKCEVKCAHLEAHAALELAREQQRSDKLSLAIGNAMKVNLEEQIVEGYQLCLQQMIALTKLTRVLDLGEKGFSYLQSAYDEARAVNVEDECMEWAADLLHMLASAERSTMAHFEQWNHGRPDDSVQREAPMTEVPPFDAGGSEAGSTAQDESVAAKDARWLDNPQIMLETGARVGTSTRIVGAKHALVPVELIVSGAPERVPELGKHVGSFQGAFEVVVLRPERLHTRWKQATMEHVVVHRTAYDPRVKFIDLVVAPNEQHVLVLCTDDKVALKHGSTSIQVQCKTVADYSLRVIPTVQASTNDTLYKTHEFAKLGSLIVEAQALGLEDHWLLETAKMVNDMQAASEASDKLKLQNALEAAVAAPPYIRMPPFAIAHFTRLRKHLLVEELLRVVATAQTTAMKHAHLLIALQAAQSIQYQGELLQSAMRLVQDHDYHIYSKVSCFMYEQAAGPPAFGRWRDNPAFQLGGLEKKTKPQTVYLAITEGGELTDHHERQWLMAQDKRANDELEAARARVRLAHVRKENAEKNQVDRRECPEIWRGLQQAEAALHAMEKKRNARLQRLQRNMQAARTGKLIQRFSGLMLSVVRNRRPTGAQFVTEGVDPGFEVLATTTPATSGDLNFLEVKLDPREGPYFVVPWSTAPDEEETFCIAAMAMHTKGIKLQHVNKWDGHTIRIESGWRGKTVKGPRMNAKDRRANGADTEDEVESTAEEVAPSQALPSLVAEMAMAGRVYRRQASRVTGEEDVPMQPMGTVQTTWTNNPQFRLWLAPSTYAPGKHKFINAHLRLTLSTPIPGAKPGLHIVRNTLTEKFDPCGEVMDQAEHVLIAEPSDNYVEQPELILETSLSVKLATRPSAEQNYSLEKFPFFVVPSLARDKGTGSFTLVVWSDVPVTLERVEDDERIMLKEPVVMKSALSTAQEQSHSGRARRKSSVKFG